MKFLDDTGIDFFYASAWFNSPTAPISKENEKYGIEGLYYRWKHSTMDSVQAIDLEKALQDRPKHSLFVSEYTQFTFWGEEMLLCNGYDRDETRQVVSTFNRYCGRQTEAAALAAELPVERLRELLRRKPFPAPPDLAEARVPAAGGGRSA